VPVRDRPFTVRPTLVGHRGLGKGVVDGLVENTTESLHAALAAGLDWVEIDVQRTSDDVLVVAHDPSLSDGSFLAETTIEQASLLGAVRLTSVLDSLPPGAGVVLDVKSSLHDAQRHPDMTTAALLARSCAELLERRRVVALSFDPAALQQMRSVLPGMSLGLLTWHRFPIGHAVAAAAHLDVEVLAVHAGSLWRNAQTGRVAVPSLGGVVDAVHRADRQLLVWCPSERRARALAAAGVDAMVVDEVPRLVRALGRSRPAAPRAAHEPLGGEG
jgi:glycerophosphoryl diester phosphodiesterase